MQLQWNQALKDRLATVKSGSCAISVRNFAGGEGGSNTEASDATGNAYLTDRACRDGTVDAVWFDPGFRDFGPLATKFSASLKLLNGSKSTGASEFESSSNAESIDGINLSFEGRNGCFPKMFDSAMLILDSTASLFALIEKLFLLYHIVYNISFK